MVTIEITDEKLINAFTKEEMQKKTIKYLNSILKLRKRKKIEKSKITNMEFEAFNDNEIKELLSSERIVNWLKKMEDIISKKDYENNYNRLF